MKFDPARSADRRRFYLDRALRHPTFGSGSALDMLMHRARENDAILPFDDIPFMLIGAHAAANYAPERATQDVVIVVSPADLPRVEQCLLTDGWTKQIELAFPSSNLGLFGVAFSKSGSQDSDVISSNANWLEAAFDAPPSFNGFKKRVMPLAYLVLMKIDSARGVDQGDLTRMLGRLGTAHVEQIVAVVERHYGRGVVGDDIRQYAEIGRWEYLVDRRKSDDRKT